MAECPICAKPAAEPFKPFCSRRCADIDLGRWLKGGYAIPGPAVGPQPPDAEGEKDPDGDEA
jgi:endogenous inhibitor of DNA gyrase (YacG/DUF329 family)